MANDIQKSVSDNNIKNGTVTTIYAKKRFYSENTYITNKPSITDIQNKYDTRFDDIAYYYTGNHST